MVCGKTKAYNMFVKLGYTRISYSDTMISYNNKRYQEITFDLKNKCIKLSNDTGEAVFGNRIYDIFNLELSVLSAINQQIKELGWYGNTKNNK